MAAAAGESFAKSNEAERPEWRRQLTWRDDRPPAFHLPAVRLLAVAAC
jgi:hypothetical protein